MAETQNAAFAMLNIFIVKVLFYSNAKKACTVDTDVSLLTVSEAAEASDEFLPLISVLGGNDLQRYWH